MALTRPRLIVLNEPTIGVDVGAREEIYRVIRREVADAAGAVIITSDFEEAAALCTECSSCTEACCRASSPGRPSASLR